MKQKQSKLVKSIIISEADDYSPLVSQQDVDKRIKSPADTCQYLKEPTYFYRKFFNLYECIKTGGGINDVCENVYCHGSKHFCKIAPYDKRERGE